MDIASLTSFAILVLAWLALPSKPAEKSRTFTAVAAKVLTRRQTV